MASALCFVEGRARGGGDGNGGERRGGGSKRVTAYKAAEAVPRAVRAGEDGAVIEIALNVTGQVAGGGVAGGGLGVEGFEKDILQVAAEFGADGGRGRGRSIADGALQFVRPRGFRRRGAGGR